MIIRVIIVNYRTPELTGDCLASLAEHVHGTVNLQVTVVDGASNDHSIDFIQGLVDARKWADWVHVMPLQRNGGFAYGNNAALQDALSKDSRPDFIWLLNPDTVVHDGALNHLIDFLVEHPEVGLVGSRLEDPDGTPQRSAFRFPTVLSEINSSLRFKPVSRLLKRFVVAPEVSESACRTDWVAGASMLVRREVFDQVGFLDDEYFMYFEEVDFCRKAAIGGWTCWYQPASRVVHLVGQASGVTSKSGSQKRRPKYWFDSRRRYFVKNHGTVYAVIVDAVWATGYSLWWLRAKLQGKSINDPPKLLTDFLRNSVWVRGMS